MSGRLKNISKIMLYIASDHAGFELKEKLKVFLQGLGYQTEDCGAFAYDENDDYPDFISVAAKKVAENPENSRGIVLGGSGQGEAMVANRIKGVRAAVFCGDKIPPAPSLYQREGWGRILTLSREHNNANILALGARFLTEDEAKKAVKLWLETPFSNEERHVRRIAKF